MKARLNSQFDELNAMCPQQETESLLMSSRFVTAM